jgi:hypothetical protein
MGYARLFINGVVSASGTISKALGGNSNDFQIGARNTYTAYSFYGYVDEFRVSKGIARWTANFTPPTDQYDVQGMNDDFTGTTGDEVNTDIWGTYAYDGTASIDTNRLKLTVPITASTWGSSGATVYSNYYLTGDFSIQIDLDSTNIVQDASDLAQFHMRVQGDNYVYTVGTYNAQYTNTYTNDGSGFTTTTTYYDNITVKLVRSGGSLTAYYKATGSWLQIGSTTTNAGTGLYRIGLNIYAGGSGSTNSHVGYADNFKINYGNVRWIGYDYRPNLKKIAMTSADGVTQLPVELSAYGHDTADEKLWLFTKIPTVYSGINTNFYLYYDKTKDDNDRLRGLYRGYGNP